jgi:hypothetical protein
MSEDGDIGALALLALGVGALFLANKRRPKPPRKDRSGEECDPLEEADGYICVAEDGDFILRPEAPKFLGFGLYPSREVVNSVLARLGFSDDLSDFQTFTSQTTRWSLRIDGIVDADTMSALKEAEELLEAGKWHKRNG